MKLRRVLIILGICGVISLWIVMQESSTPLNNLDQRLIETKKYDSRSSNSSMWVISERHEKYNSELQTYERENVILNENQIVIYSTMNQGQYRSGLVESRRAYRYGYFSFRIECEEGAGLFPAIWLLPDDGDSYPEVDIFERIGNEPNLLYGTVHYLNEGKKDRRFFCWEVDEKQYYDVGLDWQPNYLAWYIDGVKVYETNEGVPQEYMYILINQAIGGVWPGPPDHNTPFPNTFRVGTLEVQVTSQRERE